MLFNSIDFAIFLPISFILYWFVFSKNLKIQNLFLVISSYVFYGWWDWRFVFLLIFSSIANYFVGLALLYQKCELNRKTLLWISIIINLGILGLFKYYNFFVDNFVKVFSLFGGEFSVWSLNIILPVGISFYTFQTMSYSIDVYREKLNPTKNFIDFCAFVSFFPLLLSGPIERATHLLPQFHVKRYFDNNKAVNGLKLILWGLFKKIVIADNCAEYANIIFNNAASYSGSTLILGACFFTFQIYFDFSGYSDIALGTANLYGFNIKRNFNYPYFSRNMAEFWRRWHISLSTWLSDYLFLPLNMYLRNLKKIGTIISVCITFVLCGLWHGASWTYIIWGTLNAILIIPSILFNTNRSYVEIVAKGVV